MEPKSAIEDILVLAFLREGLAIRNHELEEYQKKVAMSLLAHRNDIIARKKAYRAFILLERGFSTNCRESTYRYIRSLHQGKTYLADQTAELVYGKKYPRLSRRVFSYLKSRMAGARQHS